MRRHHYRVVIFASVRPFDLLEHTFLVLDVTLADRHPILTFSLVTSH